MNAIDLGRYSVRKSFKCFLLGVTGFAVTALPAYAQAVDQSNSAELASIDAANQTSPEAEHGVEDIVVTARRRAESLQNTPVAISAITGSMLEQKKGRSISLQSPSRFQA